MKVKRVEMEAFTRHDRTTVELPDRGVVLVTGPNGGGKSSIVEAVATAGWGTTLRGTSPWRDGQPGRVRLVADNLDIERRVSKAGSKKLDFSISGVRQDHESATKAAAELLAVTGEFDQWRRSSVFSSQDAAGFASASDAERKRLLEQMLGLDRFDAALERCRAELRRARDRRLEETQHAAVLAERYEQARAELVRHDADGPPPEPPAPPAPPPAPTPADVALARSALEVAQEQREENAAAFRAAYDLERDRGRDVQDAARLLAELERQGGKCPTCGSELDGAPPDKIAEARKLKDAAVEQLRQAQAEALRLRTREEELRLQLREAERQVADLDRRRAAHDAHAAVEAAWRREHAAWSAAMTKRAARRQEIAQRAAAAEGALSDAEDARDAAAAEEAVLDCASDVLGVRGARAHVLGRALAGIEDVANAWLAQISHGMRIKLLPYTEKKSGGTSDAISMTVEGAGGGLGYRAASGGERRRIDAAILLALAEIASASSGRPPGTVFMDEVFDTLDPEGAQGVAEALTELARDRCVVVISHSDDLSRRLPGALKLRVENGRVS